MSETSTMPLQAVAAYPPGAFAWIENVTTDLPRAREFYTALFGWTSDSVDVGGGLHYGRFYVNGGLVAGMFTMTPEQQPATVASWNSYIAVESADATVKAAQAAGGTLLSGPHDVMNLGRTALLRDPSGATISLWQPGQRKGTDYAAGPGVASWHELVTHDVAGATVFYRSVFGWTGEVMEQEGMIFAGCSLDGQPISVIWNTPAYLHGSPPMWVVYFGVHDVPTSAAKVVELGGRVLLEPTEMMGVPYAVVQDPLGAVFYISGMPTT